MLNMGHALSTFYALLLSTALRNKYFHYCPLCIEKLSNLLKVTQLVSSRAEIQTKVT